MVVRMVGKEGTKVMMRARVAMAILFFTTSVLAQEPTAERRVAQGPGRNGKKHIFEHFLPFVERLKRCHLGLGGFQFSTLDLSQNVTKLLGGWEKGTKLDKAIGF